MYTLVPYRKTARIQNETLLNPFFQDPYFRSFFRNSFQDLEIKVDIHEKEDSFLMEAEMPGVSEDRINLSVENDVLKVSADLESENKKEGQDCYYSERHMGHIERHFNLEGIDGKAINADYRNGVLYINLPKIKKAEQETARKIPITVSNRS